MSECKFCNRVMVGAHPNKVFCSNKGRGNCKDLYNNRATPERRERAKRYTDKDDEHDFCDGDLSWDAHKDC